MGELSAAPVGRHLTHIVFTSSTYTLRIISVTIQSRMSLSPFEN